MRHHTNTLMHIHLLCGQSSRPSLHLHQPPHPQFVLPLISAFSPSPPPSHHYSILDHYLILPLPHIQAFSANLISHDDSIRSAGTCKRELTVNNGEGAPQGRARCLCPSAVMLTMNLGLVILSGGRGRTASRGLGWAVGVKAPVANRKNRKGVLVVGEVHCWGTLEQGSEVPNAPGACVEQPAHSLSPLPWWQVCVCVKTKCVLKKYWISPLNSILVE